MRMPSYDIWTQGRANNQRYKSMNAYQSIPVDILEKIQLHRPNLAGIIGNLKAARFSAQARQIERAIANAYLLGEVRISPLECMNLSSCCIGHKYGL